MKEPSKEVKQKYLELQLLQHQMQQVQQQVQALEQQAGEMDVVQQALDDFAQAKPGSPAIVTLTPGLFVKAKLEETGYVLLNVGGGAVVQKTVPEAKKVIAEQAAELRKLQQELAGQLRKFADNAGKVQDELRALLK
ncbi:MAG: prefoldin subunit alpha [Candidatus Woesearchaeota archaeon]